MKVNGLTDWLANLRAWQRQADPHGEDLQRLVELWYGRHGTSLVSANQLLEIAIEHDLFLEEIRGTEEKARLSSFGKRVLSRHKDTPVGAVIMRQERTNAARLWKLEARTGDSYQ